MLDSAPTEVGTVRHLGRIAHIRGVMIEQCGSKLSIPISGLGTLKFSWPSDWRRDMACWQCRGCESEQVAQISTRRLLTGHPRNKVSLYTSSVSLCICMRCSSCSFQPTIFPSGPRTLTRRCWYTHQRELITPKRIRLTIISTWHELL